jgi:hypothetical protein
MQYQNIEKKYCCFSSVLFLKGISYCSVGDDGLKMGRRCKKSGDYIPIIRFSQIWLEASYEAHNFQSSFYISGYLLERIIAV